MEVFILVQQKAHLLYSLLSESLKCQLRSMHIKIRLHADRTKCDDLDCIPNLAYFYLDYIRFCLILGTYRDDRVLYEYHNLPVADLVVLLNAISI